MLIDKNIFEKWNKYPEIENNGKIVNTYESH
jgi:hypothetical protein